MASLVSRSFVGGLSGLPTNEARPPSPVESRSEDDGLMLLNNEPPGWLLLLSAAVEPAGSGVRARSRLAAYSRMLLSSVLPRFRCQDNNRGFGPADCLP